MSRSRHEPYSLGALLQAKCLGPVGSSQPELLTAAAALPVILTAETAGSADDVWKGIHLGAVEVLEKPLSSLKLQNIWQHVVRRVRRAALYLSLSSCSVSNSMSVGTTGKRLRNNRSHFDSHQVAWVLS